MRHPFGPFYFLQRARSRFAASLANEVAIHGRGEADDFNP
jgi:hypothetical protein